MAASLQENDDLYQSVSSVLTTVAALLDFQLVDNTTSPQHPSPSKKIFTTLPHALGIYATTEQDIELGCVADMSRDTFWEYVRERLSLEPEKLVQIRTDAARVKVADIPHLQTKLPTGCGLLLGYTRMPLRETWLSKETAVRNESLAKAYDQQQLWQRLTAMHRSDDQRKGPLSQDDALSNTTAKAFRRSYLEFRTWAYCMGLLSSRLKLLSEDLLMHLHVAALSEWPAAMLGQLPDVKAFHSTLNASAFGDLVGKGRAGDRLAVISASGQDLASETTSELATAVGKALERARASPDRVLAGDLAFGFAAFLEDFSVSVKIEMRCWVPKKLSTFEESVPEVLLALQSHLSRSLKDQALAMRIWPMSLAAPATKHDGGATYLIGIREIHARQGKISVLSDLVHDFMDKVQIDGHSATICHDIVTSSQIAKMLSEGELAFPSFAKSDTAKDLPNIARTSQATHGKFRQASAALSRLQWDPVHASVDYDIGYVDRFEKDLMWKPLEQWVKLTEEEDFVPEHRIKMIRRKIDGVVVWDREAKMDRT